MRLESGEERYVTRVKSEVRSQTFAEVWRKIKSAKLSLTTLVPIHHSLVCAPEKVVGVEDVNMLLQQNLNTDIGM